MSTSSKPGGGSRASDEDSKTAVKVGTFPTSIFNYSSYTHDMETIGPYTTRGNFHR